MIFLSVFYCFDFILNHSTRCQVLLVDRRSKVCCRDRDKPEIWCKTFTIHCSSWLVTAGCCCCNVESEQLTCDGRLLLVQCWIWAVDLWWPAVAGAVLNLSSWLVMASCCCSVESEQLTCDGCCCSVESEQLTCDGGLLLLECWIWAPASAYMYSSFRA